MSRIDLTLVHTQKVKTDNQLGKVEKQHQLGKKALGATEKTDLWKIVREVCIPVVGVTCGGMWRRHGVRILLLSCALISLLYMHSFFVPQTLTCPCTKPSKR